MSGTTWSKFFWADWANDPRLKLCSFAAQGLWMRLLCIAAEHDPIGYVCVQNRPLSTTDIARLTGASEAEAADLCSELDRNGVFSRDRRGAIYSRRMVADAKSAAISKKNGKKGGNPSLSKDKGISPQDNRQDMPDDKPHKPEASIQEEKKAPNGACPKTAKSRHSYPTDFSEFWSEYPTDSLMSKQEAAKAFSRLTDDDKRAVVRSLPAFNAYCSKDATYRPVHACRYITQRRFEGFLQAAELTSSARVVEPNSPQWDAWRAFKLRNGERVAFMDSEAKAGRGFHVPSEYPPTSQPKAA